MEQLTVDDVLLQSVGLADQPRRPQGRRWRRAPRPERDLEQVRRADRRRPRAAPAARAGAGTASSSGRCATRSRACRWPTPSGAGQEQPQTQEPPSEPPSGAPAAGARAGRGPGTEQRPALGAGAVAKPPPDALRARLPDAPGARLPPAFRRVCRRAVAVLTDPEAFLL